jgi:hypothetical protein
LPQLFYPLFTFILNGALVYALGNLVPGVLIASIGTAIWIDIWVTVVNAILGAILSLDQDETFDRNVTLPMARQRGRPARTDVPGFLFLEIDGLSEPILRRALADGRMPTLKRWLDTGSHTIMGWEAEYSAQTGAMQTGILLGSNDDIPAYRWWSRAQGKIVMVGNPKDALATEQRLSNGHGLLSDGGASRGNLFSGDATESLLTYSTLLNRQRQRGPGFYAYLLSPYVLARLLTRFVNEVIEEWWDQYLQRRRKDKYIVSSRDWKYAFFRAFMGPFLQDLTTYTVISDIVRGVPALYALYAGYDDLAHFAGRDTPEAFEALHEVDRYFARVERALNMAPRPYHIVILSDHGQSSGPTFKAAYGHQLEELVKGLLRGDAKIFAELDTDEAWDNLNAVLSESIYDDTRTAGLVRRMLKSKEEGGIVMAGPEGMRDSVDAGAKDAGVAVLASGCAGLVYFTGAKQRMTYEQIQDAHPDLILGLINHPGVGFLLVNSEKNGPLAVGKGGIHYLIDNKVEGDDPLANFGPNAVEHLLRESSFEACPDLLINTSYDPATQELAGFENQASHHGGMGGPQNQPFVLYPCALPTNGARMVGAESVYRLLRSWREQSQGIPTSERSLKAGQPVADQPVTDQPVNPPSS